MEAQTTMSTLLVGSPTKCLFLEGDDPMKKKFWIWILAGVLLLAVLFTPIPSGVYKDGGSREYTALTYKIVDWNRQTGEAVYDETKLYVFPNNFKSIDALWEQEKENIGTKLLATVQSFTETEVIVEAVSNGERYRMTRADLPDIGAQQGSVVEITYAGAVLYSEPAYIQNVLSWKISGNMRHMEYTEQWLDKETAEKYDNRVFDHITITKIYKNCFFARTVIPMPYEIKLNGTLSDDWCVGDQVSCTYENTYFDDKNQRIECDMLTIEASDWEPEPGVAYKPVIYLYPEEETDVSVKLFLDGKLTCTYPAYNNGWQVTAAPNGTLTDTKGQTYNYLYWEGETNAQWDMTEGFCIKGEDTAVFLEEALTKLGLNRKEANEFIVYWLPLMEQNPYNIISFQTDIYTDAAKLEVTPAPDTVIRVFMTFKASDYMIRLLPQKLTAPERSGFTVIEWGGTEVK